MVEFATLPYVLGLSPGLLWQYAQVIQACRKGGMEDDFLEALVASERIAEWVEAIRSSSREDVSKAKAALTHLVDSVSGSQVYAEEAVLAEADLQLRDELSSHEDEACAQLYRKLSSLLGEQRVKVAEGEVREYVLRDETKVKLYEQALTHGVGAKVWHAAEILCEEISLPTWSSLLRGKTVLELGAGCGLCGLYAAKKRAKRVCLTDFEQSLLENLSRSGEINDGEDIALQEYDKPGATAGELDQETHGSGRCAVQVAKLDWLQANGEGREDGGASGGSFASLDETEMFQVILGSDLMYEMKPSLALPGVIRRHLGEKGTCLLATKRRYEKILDNFFAKARECKLRTSVKQVLRTEGDVSKESTKLFGGGHHVIMLIQHERGAESDELPPGFELAMK